MPEGRGTVLAFTDISERHWTVHALRERDAILSALGQPVWVITHEGVISYVNPAAVTALGFDNASELIGQNGHWLVHYKHPDGSRFPIEDCPLARVREAGEPLYLIGHCGPGSSGRRGARTAVSTQISGSRSAPMRRTPAVRPPTPSRDDAML